MKALLCQLILSCFAHGPDPTSIEDLHYGTILYAYYQGDYATALVGALVAEKRGLRGEDPLRFELAEGSFAFNDEMYRYSREIFDALDESQLTDLDRLRLSFHLAREYFRREDWQEVDTQIGRIDLGKSWLGRRRFHPEVEFMRAELLARRGDFVEAEKALDRLDEADPFRAYGLFNLGVAMRAAGNLASAEKVFSDLSEMDGETNEARDLAQRSKVAVAFIKRELNANTDAADVLANLPAKGRYRDLALATYGGLAMQQQDYELASRIWMTLQNQKYWTPSTATARLGFPVSLEHLSSPELALTQYRVAERSFESRLDTLVVLIERADDPEWVADLLEVFSTPERDSERVAELVARWGDELGHTDWLEWLSKEDVHKLLVQWRSLMELQNWLGDLPETLDVYQEVANEQKRRAQVAGAVIYGEDIGLQREVLAQGLDALGRKAARFERAQPARTTAWMSRVATPEEAEMLEAFGQMREIVRRGVPRADQERWLSRITRVEGLLFWDLVDEAPVRLRALMKQLGEAHRVVEATETSVQRIGAAESAFVAGVETDFNAFRDRARELGARVETALHHRQEMLAKQLREGMRRELHQVQHYLLITRIALARATDKLAMGAPQQ
ncbi:MAG: hypothetical protein O7H39_01755 [Gammaproteobacteria bacterium]|nr:hypothetical protein [Gammaproteobacteria bacterium]